MVDKLLLKKHVKSFLILIKEKYTSGSEDQLLVMIEELKASIPEKRKASYGIVSVIAVFCKHCFKDLSEIDFKACETIYRKSKDFRTVCIGLGLLSHYGINNPESVLPVLTEAADHALWEVKEFVQMFLRKITKKHKELVQGFLIELTASDNPNLRRFASESIRPVAENKWIQEDPEFSLKVLRNLFRESEDFPRVSVANNLSDLSRKNPELIFTVVEELKGLHNKNSDWIAYRACRNLINQDPIRVMNLMKIDVYKYKNKVYHRPDSKGRS